MESRVSARGQEGGGERLNMSSANARFLDDRLGPEKDYWLRKLAGELGVTGVPLDFNRPGEASDETAAVGLGVGPDTSARLLSFCREQESLIFTALVAALKICLYKYTGVEDVIVGTTIHERHAETSALNRVLALRDRVRGGATVKELLEEVRRTVSEAYANQKYPLDRVLELLNVERPANRESLFNVALVLKNINNPENLRGLKHDLTLLFELDGGRLMGTIEYNPRLFKKETLEVFGEHYRAILRAVLDGPSAEIVHLQLLSADKQRQLILDFNQTRRVYPKHQPIHTLFEEQVERTPGNPAVRCRERRLTYDELNRRANQLAHHLRRSGVGPGVLVGLYLEHSIETVVALLGVLKAGGAYVPFDPAHPKARLAFMLEDAKIKTLLTQQRLAGQLPSGGALKLCLDSEWPSLRQEDEANPTAPATAEDLAYVIYTSGSTGQPKGVKIRHASLVNYTCWASEVYLQNESLSFPLYSSLAFDLTVTSIYTPLLTGNEIVIYPAGDRESPVTEIIKDNQVGVLKLTPSHLALIKDRDNSRCRIKRLIVGGEAFETGLARQVYESFGGAVEIYNEYGPTEATVGAMIHRYDPARDERAFVPVGRPAANVQLYVLDESLKPVPENVKGELYIAGDGLAEGYLNRDQLTAEKFISNPFTPGAKMYQTGDVARWLPEGLIDFIGRSDEQIKFHGYRVELNEIRSALNRHPQVRESVVVVAGERNGGEVLLAYYVSRQELEADQLRAFLAESVIEETIPNLFVHLKKLPLTLNGKINYSALPTLEEERERLKSTFVPPRTPAEEVLAKIWAEVLGLERVGVHDNFFKLGGHSLLATQVISRVRQALRKELPLHCLFETPTVAGLAESVGARNGGEAAPAPAIERVPREGELPLSFAQQRLWFFHQLEPDSVAYNIPGSARLVGPLNLPAFDDALGEVVRRHETLRTTFPATEGSPAQAIHPPRPQKLPMVDLSPLPRAERERATERLAAEEARRPFELGRGPLLRVRLLRLGPHEHAALFTMHHIVGDAWSSGVFVRELAAFYEAFSGGTPSPFAELPIQYADFARWQRRLLRGEVLEAHLDYWRQQLSGAPRVMELLPNRPRPAVRGLRGAKQSLALSKSLSDALHAPSQREGVTLFMTLLAAFNVLLRYYVRHEDIVVGTDVANRNRAETEGLIGFFVNQLVLRVSLAGDPTYEELLGRVREVALGAYAHQDLPFDRLVEALKPERDLSRNPLFQIMFSFQNTPAQALELPGLSLSRVGGDKETSVFDLSLYMTETAQGLVGWLRYDTDLFPPAMIGRLLEQFELILRQVVSQPRIRLSALEEILAEADRRQQQSVEKELEEASLQRLKQARRKPLGEPQPAR